MNNLLLFFIIVITLLAAIINVINSAEKDWTKPDLYVGLGHIILFVYGTIIY